MLKPVFIETSTGSLKAQSVAPNVFDFDVTNGLGQSNFAFTSGLMTATSYVEALVNGRESREGVSDDFQRDVANSRIVYNFSVAQNAWVRIKIYPFGVAV